MKYRLATEMNIMETSVKPYTGRGRTCQCPAGSVIRNSPMAGDTQTRLQALAFTLIELLVVISIIGILAGLLLPTLSAAKKKAKIQQARIDMKNIGAGIMAYENDYSRFPTPFLITNNQGNLQDVTLGLCPTNDIKYPGVVLSPWVNPAVANAGNVYFTTNADLFRILLDEDVNTPITINFGHAKNPRQQSY
ncbi:MAG: prepilin-type N-terminal cleavage/methylation domain-containing protein, partial [Verrucomicrobiae bacterium]|nr:prepilin-type N-terminal cleavage/methylation domain-containing protein [Verrucomicrobiae bacterium]